MACPELERLREDASQVKRQLAEARAEANERPQDRRSGVRAESDMRAYLQRRLAKAAAEVERHLAEHHCA